MESKKKIKIRKEKEKEREREKEKKKEREKVSRRKTHSIKMLFYTRISLHNRLEALPCQPLIGTFKLHY